MLNKLTAALREMTRSGERLTCAVSGGADSVALLFGVYLLKDKLGLSLSAAHFNHHLRGEESDADEAFVREFCARYDIPLFVGGAEVKPGDKGLEAAAREERYAFLRTLPGKIATAHTADDNAETVLMHLLRGTGLKGLGGITPVQGNVIRPMLDITRQEVEDFLAEYWLPHREDSSNSTDQFLRNRIRHEVMPVLRSENPSFSRSVSAMAGRLRQDEDCLQKLLAPGLPSVPELRTMHRALRVRYLERFLKESGIPEPEQTHLRTAEELVFSEKPSARADFPGGVVVTRNYDTLQVCRGDSVPEPVTIACPGVTDCPRWGIRVLCSEEPGGFGVKVFGTLTVRTRQSGDAIRLPGGTKPLKKLYIDRKIPAQDRPFLPVLADERGVLYAAPFGFHRNREEQNPQFYLTILDL